jgi:hypothetical protein
VKERTNKNNSFPFITHSPGYIVTEKLKGILGTNENQCISDQ